LNCLEVIQLVIQRSPQVIAVKSDHRQDDPDWTPPLYTWLFPRLLPLLVSSQPVQVRDGVSAIYDAILHASMKCARSNQSESLLEYFRISLLGKLPFYSIIATILKSSKAFFGLGHLRARYLAGRLSLMVRTLEQVCPNIHTTRLSSQKASASPIATSCCYPCVMS
jgi:hypothetical protein